MIGLLLVSHGQLGRVLLESAAEIVGPFPKAEAISVDRQESLTTIQARIEAALQSVDEGQGVLILADMFGGTAANMALRLVGSRPIEIVTGCNLPMLLKVSSARPRADDLASLAQLVKFYGKSNVLLASEMLKEKEMPVES